MINPLKNTEIVKERYRGIRRHALITKEIRRKLPKLYSQNGNKIPWFI